MSLFVEAQTRGSVRCLVLTMHVVPTFYSLKRTTSTEWLSYVRARIIYQTLTAFCNVTRKHLKLRIFPIQPDQLTNSTVEAYP